ncbi:ComEC/Rec2 family competence protein [Actinomadura adrarensis]|uniref:ComEC/Rec2 family competence protein n=1 Tax=Actinomadura adrarensis TaxID=1819600 RepID=A0ABW3CS90_9ACTN
MIDDELEVTILDVGHGNSAMVRDGRRCTVIDAEPGVKVADELERVQCEHIEHLIFSHSDNDHAGGGPLLLLDQSRTIGTVWFNADSRKNTKIWKRLRYATQTRFRHGGLGGHQMIHTATGQEISCGRARLEVCHPSAVMALIGPKRITEFGDLTANTLSVVIRVHLGELPAALLAADIDGTALKHIQDNGHELSAPVLVFPHHGGKPGKEAPYEFAKSLTELVRPELVIFSIRGGSRPANPQPEIVRGVRHAMPQVHIACTQLSVHCRAPGSPGSRDRDQCCAGTLTIRMTPDGLTYTPSLSEHRQFISLKVQTPLCRRETVTPSPRQPVD